MEKEQENSPKISKRMEARIQEVDSLFDSFSESNSFYITDTSDLTVEAINKIRRKCFEKGVKLRVAKNKLIQKALQRMDADTSQLEEVLKGPSTLIFSSSATLPAKLIKELSKEFEKPEFKGAYVDGDVFVGKDQLSVLASLKSKEELLGDIMGMLLAPVNNVVGALQSGQNSVSGVLSALEKRV